MPNLQGRDFKSAPSFFVRLKRQSMVIGGSAQIAVAVSGLGKSVAMNKKKARSGERAESISEEKT